MKSEAEEWLGAWWRPGTDDRVGGQLVFDPRRGVSLTLFGSLFDWSAVDLSEGFSLPLRDAELIPVLHGRAKKAISILEARCDFPVPPGTDGFEGWDGIAIVEGHLAPAKNGAAPTFTGVQFELDALPAWARARRIALRIGFQAGQTEATVRPHELARAGLTTGETVLIEQLAITAQKPREYLIQQPVRLSIAAGPPRTWTELLNQWLQPIQVLLWLATGVPSRATRIALFAPDSRSEVVEWRRLWVPLVEPSRDSNRDLHQHEVLFFADELPGGFGLGIERWLLLWRRLQHVLGPLYARASAPFAYANDRFYAAVAAIEAYHRSCVESERDLPRAEHRGRVERIDKLTAEHAPDLRDWAVNAVRPFNKVPLWRRITMIAEGLPGLSADLFDDRLELFARTVERARNGHAHALPSAGPSKGGEVLYLVADALVWMLRACVMVDLGIWIDEVEQRIRRHERFRWTAHRLGDVRSRLGDSGPL